MGLIEGITSSVTLGVAGVVAITSLAAWSLSKHDTREPPLAPSSIPLIGHIIGMSKETFNYYVNLSKRIASPIFTVNLPGQKMYVVSSSDLIQKIQKQHEVIAFPPLAARFAAGTAGTNKHSQRAVEEDNFALVHETADVLVQALRPGENLDRMNRVMLQELNNAMQRLQPAAGQMTTIQFNEWLRANLTTATTRAIYGPKNPYEDKEVADAFWEYEKGLIALAIGVLPYITARKAAMARDKIVTALRKYYDDGGLDSASRIAQDRFRLGTRHGVTGIEIAKFEAGMAIAALVNTGPATFWMILLVNSDPSLLDELRAEVDACTRTTVEHGVITKTIDILNLKQNCPLFLSAYQEMLRYSAIGTPVRLVMEDTYVDSWLLKKGAMVHMPSRAVHYDTEVYGPTAGDFVPRRFLASEKKNRPKDHAFRTFGGGKHLCPGRHFATNEILATTAMFIARFDMEPTSGGKWELPTVANTGAGGQIMEPDYDVAVNLKTRAGYEGVTWALQLDTSDRVMAFVAEDVDSE